MNEEELKHILAFCLGINPTHFIRAFEIRREGEGVVFEAVLHLKIHNPEGFLRHIRHS